MFAQIGRGMAEYNTMNLHLDLGLVICRPAPNFLGPFEFKMYYEVPPLTMATRIRSAVNRLKDFIPNQQFNTLFIQKYLPGQAVKPHRDPRNNTGHTIIGLFGEDWETELVIHDGPHAGRYIQRPGDVFVLPCTIDGVQGPRHSVNWLNNSGIRYAIILNSIVR